MSRIPLAALIALSAFSAAALAQSAEGPPRFFEHMLKKWDTNGDGRISLDEYLAAATAQFQRIDAQNTGSVSAAQIANSPKAGERMERRANRLVQHIDSSGKGYITQDEFVAAARNRFAKLDKNADGKLTPDELARPRRHAEAGGTAPAGERAQGIQRRFDKLDANHDGIVTLNEYVAAATADYKAFDTAHNGRVTAAEIAASPKAHERAEHVAERIVRRLDANGDGMVTRDEFLAAARQRFARIDKNADGFIEAGEIGQRHRMRDGAP